MFNAKGQVATEYMIMFGVLLIIIAALAAYSFFIYNETTSTNQVQTTLKDLKAAVNLVASLGEGNSVVIEITLPQGVSGTNIPANGRAIYITNYSFGSDMQDFIETDANLSGALPQLPGTYDIVVSNNNGVVNLGVAG